jgi:hypothetical protein
MIRQMDPRRNARELLQVDLPLEAKRDRAVNFVIKKSQPATV